MPAGKNAEENMPKSLEEIVQKSVNLYKNNRFVNINLNILVAGVPAFAAVGVVSKIMECYEYSKSAIAGAALVADLAVYFPVQSILHFYTNRNQYLNEYGNVNKKLYVKDLCHVYATKLPVWAVTIPLCPVLQYYLMRKGMGSVESSQVAYWGMTFATRIAHSLLGCMTGLFKTTKPSGL